MSIPEVGKVNFPAILYLLMIIFFTFIFDEVDYH
jgi:hypothetical protein